MDTSYVRDSSGRNHELYSQVWIYEDILMNGFPTYILTTGSEMGSQMLDPQN